MKAVLSNRFFVYFIDSLPNCVEVIPEAMDMTDINSPITTAEDEKDCFIKNGKYVIDKLIRELDSPEKGQGKIATKIIIAMSRISKNHGALKKKIAAAKSELSEKGQARIDEILKRWQDPAIPTSLGDRYSNPRKRANWFWY